MGGHSTRLLENFHQFIESMFKLKYVKNPTATAKTFGAPVEVSGFRHQELVKDIAQDFWRI